MLTADTITDEQIREVFKARPDVYFMHKDEVNLHETVEPYASIRRAARARCAEILNARAAKEPACVGVCDACGGDNYRANETNWCRACEAGRHGASASNARAAASAHAITPEPSNGGQHACSCGLRWMSLEQADEHRAAAKESR